MIFAKRDAATTPNAAFVLGGITPNGFANPNIIGFATPPAHAVPTPGAFSRYSRGFIIRSQLTGTSNTGAPVTQGTYQITVGAARGGANVVSATAYRFTGSVGRINIPTALLDPGWYTLVTRVGDAFNFWETTVFTPFQIIIPAIPVPPMTQPDLFIPARTMPGWMKTFGNDTNGTLYEYAELNVNKLGDDFDLPIILTFSVEKNWFTENDVEPEDMRLNWYNEGVWSELPTEFIEERGSRYVYKTTLYTFTKYFAVAARPGDCRDFGCGETEKCVLLKVSYYCVPIEESCNVECGDGEILDELTCACISPEQKITEKAEEVNWIAIVIGIMAAILLIGVYLLLTRKKPRVPDAQKNL